LAAAADALPAYSATCSRTDFTPHRRFAPLVPRAFLRADYRGLEALRRDWSGLRQAPGLAKVPDHATLPKAAPRLPETKGDPPASAPPSPVPARAA